MIPVVEVFEHDGFEVSICGLGPSYFFFVHDHVMGIISYPSIETARDAAFQAISHIQENTL